MSRFIKNPHLASDLRRMPGLNDAKRKAAHEIKRNTEAAAPHGTGDYGDSIQVFEEGDHIGVETTDPFWHLIEFGSVHNPAYAPLRRGARAAGVRLEETPK